MTPAAHHIWCSNASEINFHQINQVNHDLIEFNNEGWCKTFSVLEGGHCGCTPLQCVDKPMILIGTFKTVESEWNRPKLWKQYRSVGDGTQAWLIYVFHQSGFYQQTGRYQFTISSLLAHTKWQHCHLQSALSVAIPPLCCFSGKRHLQVELMVDNENHSNKHNK